jgi:hypothetical protein
MYLSDALTIHHKIKVGIIGIEYLSIEDIRFFDTDLKLIKCTFSAISEINNEDIISDRIIERIYPSTPNLNTAIKIIFNRNKLNVVSMPSMAYSFK